MTSPGRPAAAVTPPAAALGIACGAGAALFWACGFAAARHGIEIGLTPGELALHRFAGAGIALLPAIGWSGPDRIRWHRAMILTLFGGLPFAVVSYSGFLLVPLGHGGVIQPASAALGGLVLAVLVLAEPLPVQRLVGAVVIVAGLVVIGFEALTTIGMHGLLGDVAFVAAGVSYATFAMLLRLWRIAPLRAAAVVSVVSLLYVPVHGALFGFGHLAAFGPGENLLQAVAQGVLAGPTATYLFARAVMLLGVGRGAVFPSLVPPFTLLIGFLALGAVPSAFQLAGLGTVLLGFRLTQKP